MKLRLIILSIVTMVCSLSSNAGNILIYGPFLRDAPNEKTLAELAGHTVTVVTAAQWVSMTTAQFASYDAIIIPDNACSEFEGNSSAGLQTINSTKLTWSPAITGKLYMSFADATLHRHGQWQELITNGINFVVNSGGTGLYVALSCMYYSQPSGTPLTFLSEVESVTISGGYGDMVTILESSHSAMSGLTNMGLSNWGYTAHGKFVSYSSSLRNLATTEIGSFILASEPGPVNSISTSINSGIPLCITQNVSLSYNTTGTYNVGNTFTAQLSNAFGSFASPVIIGSVSATTSGTINANIPATISAGTGYRIRVVASNPAIIGTDNGSNIAINALPAATVTAGGSTTFCPNGSVTLTASEGDSYLWSNGATTQAINATESGNYSVIVTTNGCSSTSAATDVIVQDNLAPVPNITNLSDAIGECFVTVSKPAATDNCKGQVTATTTDPLVYATQGTYTITWTYDDGNGNTSTQKQNVKVQDITPPTITCSSDMIVNTDAGMCNATVTVPKPETSDNCGGAPTSYTLDFTSGTKVSHYAGDIEYTEDGMTLKALGSFDWRHFHLSSNANYLFQGEADAVEFTANGNSFDLISVEIKALGSTFVSPTGAKLTVTSLGVFTFPNTSDWRNITSLKWLASGVTIIDNVIFKMSGASAVTLTNDFNNTDDASDTYPFGTTIIKWTAKDAVGKTSTCEQKVIVKDNQAPIPDVTTLEDATGECSVTVSNPTATDKCMGSITATTTDPLTYSAQGTYTVTWIYDDGNGNTSTQTQKIIIKDISAPTLRGEKPAETLAASCDNIPAAQEVNAEDNCDPAPEVIVDEKSTKGADATLSSYYNYKITRKWTATDVNGNSQEIAVQEISVTDGAAPTFGTMPANTKVSCEASSAPAATGTATGSDNCDDNPKVTYSDNSTKVADPTKAGHYNYAITRTWKIEDVTGNADTYEQTITVEDKTAPTPKCQAVSVYLGLNGEVSITPAQVNNGSTDNCTDVQYLDLSLDQTTFTAAGVYTVTLTVTDVSGNPATCQATITVKKRPTTLVYTGDLSEQYSDQQELKAVLTDVLSNTPVNGKTISFTLGTQSGTGTTAGLGEAVKQLIITQDPAGTYKVVSEFAGDAIFEAAKDDNDVFDITQEDARAFYTGAVFASTSGATTGKATITLSATIKDITSETGDPAYDGFEGDIRNATVTFINRETNTDIATVNVGLVNLADIKVGTATFNWPVDIGSSDAKSYTIGIRVNKYYTRDVSNENTVVTVAKPLNDFITGGGYIILENSSGQKAGDKTTKNNFGFNVKFNRKGTSLQGSINTIIRRTEKNEVTGLNELRVYQVKGNVMSSLVVDASKTTSHPYPTAIFNGKASIQDITNPLLPISVDGGASLQVTMTDAGEPGSSDKVGITVWNKAGGLWYTSNWDGTRTIEQKLDGGNLKVSGGSFSTGTAVTTGTKVTPDVVEERPMVTALTLKVLPNPSSSFFTLQTLSNSDQPVNMRIVDMFGRTLEAKRGLSPNGTMQIGHNYRPGSYFVELIQGTQKRSVKLIKLAN